ncbi:hypothetical protein niasHT_032339 [Heterodera trifolii]|uniref:C3H1-type domain-containing protein n=1 Tax=Heterodera trifolii TaxID=157864 RepID=A0ABD2HR64_9BILA
MAISSSFLGLYFAIIWLFSFNERANGSGGGDKLKTIGESSSNYVSVDQIKKMQKEINALEEEVKELKKQMNNCICSSTKNQEIEELKSQLFQSNETVEILSQEIIHLQQQVNVLIENQNNILAALCNGIDYNPQNQQQHNWTDEGSQSPSQMGPFADGSTDFSLFGNMPLLRHSQTDSQTEPPKPTDSYAEVAAKPSTVANIRQNHMPMPLASVEPKKKSPTNENEEEKAAGKDSPYKQHMCVHWSNFESGKSRTKCPNGANCKYAHGQKELKAAIPPNYKTEVCKRWSSGTCINGEGCHFAHGQKELRQLGVTKKSSNVPPSPSKSHQTRRKT